LYRYVSFLFSLTNKYRTLRENLKSKVSCILDCMLLTVWGKYRTLRRIRTTMYQYSLVCSTLCLNQNIGLWGRIWSPLLDLCYSFHVVLSLQSIGLWGRICTNILHCLLILIIWGLRKYRTLRENLYSVWLLFVLSFVLVSMKV
jgi:hypothetical protein